MNSILLVKTFWQHMNQREWDQAKNLLAENFIAEWPQSRVRYNGPHNFMMMNSSYPGNHDIKILDIYDAGEKIISKVEIKSEMPDGKHLHLFAISFFEVKNNKIIKAEEYWADVYEAPMWQEQWCERF